MVGAHSPRERLLWRLFWCGVLSVYASAYFVQVVMLALRERALLGPTILGLFLVCGAAVGAYLVRQRPGPAEVALLVAALGVYVAYFRHLEILQERIHLLLYGALGSVAWTALHERQAQAPAGAPPAPLWRRPLPGAILLTALAGWGDELVQGVLPNRMYDNRDVLTNALAGALAVGVLEARRALRARRRGNRGDAAGIGSVGAQPKSPSSV